MAAGAPTATAAAAAAAAMLSAVVEKSGSVRSGYTDPLSPSSKNNSTDENNYAAAAVAAAAAAAEVTVIAKVAEFAHPRQYLFFGLVSRAWRDGWHSSNRPKLTSYVTPARLSEISSSTTTDEAATSAPIATGTAATATVMTVPRLRYNFENGLPRNRVGVCEAVARTGNLDLLKCAREYGCPWNQRTATAAAEEGHLHILKWARAEENGRCPWHENTCMGAAQGKGSLETRLAKS